MISKFDVAIVGGGPGGYVAAIRAAQLGKTVALIEESNLGGTCLNKGCIPTKAILKSADVLQQSKHSEVYGVKNESTIANLQSIIDRAKGVIHGLRQGVTGLMNKNKITVFEKKAVLKDRNTISAGDIEITAQNIVIATGSKPRIFPGLEDLISKGLIWTSKEAINPTYLPNKILIVGSGAIGIELASFYNSLGSDVTVVEIQDSILIQEDIEISSAARQSFQKKGIKIKAKSKVEEYVESCGKVLTTIKNADSTTEKEIFDTVILAVGVVPNTGDLGLEKIGIKTKANGEIIVNEFNQTSISNIYAIGDITEAPWLAHKASREGVIVAEHISGKNETKKSVIPACTYSNPQIASVGLTEEKAKEVSKNIKVGKSYFRGNGKALAAGESEGFVKVIFDGDTGELLGAHMIGHKVTELIALFSLAITSELTETEFMNTVFPHPTITEVIQEAVLSAYGKALHG